MKFLLMAAVLASSVAVMIAVIRVFWRPQLHSHSSTERLGPVSDQWLTAHRGER
jgi:hypothetical protein